MHNIMQGCARSMLFGADQQQTPTWWEVHRVGSKPVRMIRHVELAWIGDTPCGWRFGARCPSDGPSFPASAALGDTPTTGAAALCPADATGHESPMTPVASAMPAKKKSVTNAWH